MYHNVDEPGQYYGKRKQPDTKGPVSHDSICMKRAEEVNLQRQKADWWLPGTGEGGLRSDCLTGISFPLRGFLLG